MNNLLLILKIELKNFFRDKQTIIHSIVMPIALYPLLFWGMNQIFVLQQGSLENMPSRVAFIDSKIDEIAFLMMESSDDFEIKPGIISTPISDEEDLRNLDIDAGIQVNDCDPVLKIRVIYDSASDRSKEALKRLDKLIVKYNLELIRSRAGFDIDARDYRVISVDLSSRDARSKYLLGLILPMIMIIITVMGGLYPAIEVLVSERERSTIETTLMMPVRRYQIILGKFMSVILMCMLAGLLNLFSILITIKHTLFSSSDLDSMQFRIPMSAIPLMLLGMFLIASAFSAGMILVSAFARTYKEAQSLIAPLYAIGIQPAVVSALPGVEFNNITALIPITNLSLMFRELIRGKFHILPIVITLGSLSILCFFVIFVANWIFSKEELVTGLDREQIKSMIFRKIRLRKG